LRGQVAGVCGVIPTGYNTRSSLDYLIYVLALAIVGVGAFGVYDTFFFTPRSQRAAGATEVVKRFIVPKFAPAYDRANVLLIGADDRPGEGGRADTIILLMIDKPNHRASVLSIPRDLKVDIPGPKYGMNKINAAYSFYHEQGLGEEKTVEAVEELTGLDIYGYIKVNMQGVVKIIDTLGGVDINVEKEMNWECPGDIVCYLKPGPQHLNGEKFLSYIRHRKDFKPENQSSDFERMARAQKALREVLKQHLRPQNLRKVAAVVRQLRTNVKTNMDINDLVGLACFLRGIDPDDIMAAAVPCTDDNSGPIYYAICDQRGLTRTLDELIAHLDNEPPKPCRVEVLNGSGEPGVANAASKLLEAYGFEVTHSGNADSFDYDKTRIEYQAGEKESAKLAASAIGSGTLEALDPVNNLTRGAHIRVIVGADFHKPASVSEGLPADPAST